MKTIKIIIALLLSVFSLTVSAQSTIIVDNNIPSFYRTLTGVVNDYANFGTVTPKGGTCGAFLTLSNPSGQYISSTSYLLSLGQGNTGGAWRKVNPMGSSQTKHIQLEVRSWNTDSMQIRVKNIIAFTAGSTARLDVKNTGNGSAVLWDNYDTGTDTTALSGINSLDEDAVKAALGGFVTTYTNKDTVADGAGNTVFYLTSDKTSTGTALYSDVNSIVATPNINDQSNVWLHAYSISLDLKTLTVNSKFLTLPSLVVANVPNGTVVEVTVNGK